MNCELSQVLAVVANRVALTRGVAAESVQTSTKLLQEGLLDSFGLVELIVELEKSLGSKIPEGMLLPEDFESVEILFERLQQI